MATRDETEVRADVSGSATKPGFAADATIGIGRWPLAPRFGVVVIEEGVLIIRKRNGDPIVSGVAVSEVRARPQRLSGGDAVRVWMADRTYVLGWNPGAGALTTGVGALATDLTLGAGGLVKGVAALPGKRNTTNAFLAVVDAYGGTICSAYGGKIDLEIKASRSGAAASEPAIPGADSARVTRTQH